MRHIFYKDAHVASGDHEHALLVVLVFKVDVAYHAAVAVGLLEAQQLDVLRLGHLPGGVQLGQAASHPLLV